MDFPEELARKQCVLVARRVCFRFGAFPDLDEEDLVSEAMLAALKAWPEYVPKSPDNPHAVAPSSFIYMVGWRQLVDLYRTRSRRGQHETRAVEEQRALGDPEEIAEPEEEDDLAEWAGMIYAKSLAYLLVRGEPAESMNAGHFAIKFTAAHTLTLLAIKQRTDLSLRALVYLLRRRKDVRDAIRLPRIPHYSTLSRVYRSVARLRPKRVRRAAEAA